MMAWNVVIAGGGFGGSSAARELERLLPKQSARLILVNDVNFILYTPFLPEAAAGTLEPRHVVTPLRDILRRTNLRLGAVTGHDPAARTVELRGHDGSVETLRYDQLLVALGSVSRSLPIPGLDRHAIGFKSLADAIWLRNHLVETLEQANATEDPARREELLTYVFVGGGYSGLEALAELQDFAVDAIDRYPRARLHGMRWILVEAADRVLPEVPIDLADYAVATAARSRDRHPPRHPDRGGGRGLDPALHRRAGPDPDPGLDGRRQAAPVASPPWRCRSTRRAACASTSGCGSRARAASGRSATAPRSRTPTAPGARARRPRRWRSARARRSPTTSPPSSGSTSGRATSPTRAARRSSTSAATRPSGKIGRLKFRGFLAWWMARTYHMSQIPGLARKIRAVVDWTVGLPFRRDTAEVGSIGHPRPLSGEVYARGGTHRPID